MTTEKREYQAAVKEIRKLLDAEAHEYLQVIEHYVGELRRSKAAADAKTEAVQKSLTAVQQQVQIVTGTIAKLRTEAEATQQQLHSTLGQLRREQQDMTRQAERWKWHADNCQHAFSHLVSGREFIMAPGQRVDDRSFQICLAIENIPNRFLTDLVATVPAGMETPISDAQANELLAKLTEQKLGISPQRYREIVRTTYVHPDSRKNLKAPHPTQQIEMDEAPKRAVVADPTTVRRTAEDSVVESPNATPR